jgi:hypothetical protein
VEPHFFWFDALQGGEAMYGKNQWEELATSFKQLVESNPRLIWLLAAGFLVFLIIVADAWWFKRRHRRKDPRKW